MGDESFMCCESRQGDEPTICPTRHSSHPPFVPSAIRPIRHSSHPPFVPSAIRPIF
jgi:hypothetical protein